jgi:hypothetical protein
VTLCQPQIQHDPTWDQTWIAAVLSLQLTAWARAGPFESPKYESEFLST